MKLTLTAERREYDYGHPEAERPRPTARILRVSEGHRGSVSGVMSEALQELKYELVDAHAEGEFIQPSLWRWVHVWSVLDEDRHLFLSWILAADMAIVPEGNVIPFPVR